MGLSERVAALERAGDESVANHLRVILRQVEKVESKYGLDPRFRVAADRDKK